MFCFFFCLFFFRGGVGPGGRVGGQGGCERRIEVFVQIQKKKIFFFIFFFFLGGGGVWVGGSEGIGRGGDEGRCEVFVKFKKILFWGGVGSGGTGGGSG